MTNIHLEIRAFSVFEITEKEAMSRSRPTRLWYQGGGFNVYVTGLLSQSYVTRDNVSHAALASVQASGGRVSHLRDINAANRHTARKNEQLEAAKKLTRSMFDDAE